MQFTPLGPWGVGASGSAVSATEGIKGLSGRVADRYPLEGARGYGALRVGKGKSVNTLFLSCFYLHMH